MLNVHLILHFIFLLAAVSATSKLPKNWKVCKTSDTNYNECLKGAIFRALRDLKNGNAQFKLPKIDPLQVGTIVLKQGASQSVSVTITFKNLKMIGFSNIVVDKVITENPSQKIIIDVHTEGPFRLEGDYVSKGRILLIPINGIGKSTLKFDNFKARLIFTLRKVKKGNQDFLEVVKTDVAVDTTRLHLTFKRTANINEGLSANLNTFLNENWKDILQDMKPSISDSFGDTFRSLANKVFTQVPYDQMFPS